MAFRVSRRIFAGLKLAGAIGAAPVLVLAFCSFKPANADDPLLKQIFDRQAAAAIAAAKSPHKNPIPSTDGAKILVLTDGRVVDGEIRADLHGYRVETAEANLFFTFDQVKLVARDRADAYQKMCASEPSTPRRDMRLGRWCLENRLPHEAAFHLRKVLETDPTNQAAKELLGRLETAPTSGGFVQVGGTAEHVPPDAKIVESLARLSPGTVKEFVIGVQPILLARCGSTRCHGGPATENSFHLERVHLAAGGSRLITGHNLDSVLHQVDPHFARRSALLLRASEAHGGTAHPPLSGGGADVQKARLIAWLMKAAPEVKRLNQEDAARRSVEKVAQAGKTQPHRDPHVVPASASMVEENLVRPAALVPNAVPQSAPSKSADRSANDLGPLTDPFDPSQFNRSK
jgi:hypothetical protein